MKLKSRFLLFLIFVSSIFALHYVFFEFEQVELELRETKTPVRPTEKIHKDTKKRHQVPPKPRKPVTRDCKLQLPPDISPHFTTDNIMDNLNFTTGPGGDYKVHLSKDDSISTHNFKYEEHFKVIVVPHSIVDPAYLINYKETYSKVKPILDQVVVKLLQYPQMKFIWSEASVLSAWLSQQNITVRNQLKLLIKNGQLELVSGGSVVPDQGTTHYQALIQNIIDGSQWIYQTFGVKPVSNLAVGPTGHSSTFSHLLELSGIKFMVIDKVHEAIRNYMTATGKFEFTWRQFWDVKSQTDIHCHAMPFKESAYSIAKSCGPKPKVCSRFDFLQNPPLLDSQSENDPDFIVMASALYEQYRLNAKLSKYNTALIPLGGIFRWTSSTEWDSHYESYEKLFKYINSRNDWNMSVKFGTLKNYYDELDKSGEKKTGFSPSPSLPVFGGDFFPYSDKNNEYWSGLYTSRPWLKYLGREVESIVRAADILHLLACATNPYSSGFRNKCRAHGGSLQEARNSVADFQHHKAITGISKSKVILDFQHKLSDAYRKAEIVISWALPIRLVNNDTVNITMFASQSLPVATEVNQNPSPAVFKNGYLVVIFNPLPIDRNEAVTVRVNNSELIVSRNGFMMPSQILPVLNLKNQVHPKLYDITFTVQLPPLGLETVRIFQPQSGVHVSSLSELKVKDMERAFKTRSIFKTQPQPTYKEIVIENDCLRIEFEGEFGLMRAIFDKVSLKRTLVEIEFLRYTPYNDGPHVFQTQDHATPFLDSDTTNVLTNNGKVKSSVTVLNRYFQHTISLYNTTGPNCWSVHVDNLALLNNANNFELVMRVKTDLKNHGELYTDSNGFQMLKRTRRPKLPLGGNTYPMTSMAFIQSRTQRLTVHSFQALGVSSIRDGILDILLDRTMDTGDGRGHDEGLPWTPPAPSRFMLSVETAGKDMTDHSETTYPTLLSYHINDHLQNPVIMFQYAYKSKPLHSPTKNGLKTSLPCDLHLVSLRELKFKDTQELNGALILHKRGARCNPQTSHLTCAPIEKTLKLKSFFRSVKQPTTLSQWSISYLEKLENKSSNDTTPMQPMDVFAFRVQWNK